MDIQVAKRLSGTEEYYFARKLREIEELNRSGDRVINLGIGSPDLPPAPSVIDTLQKEAVQSDNHGYQGYRGSVQLRSAIRDWYERHYGVILDPESEILPLMGSKEGIVHVCMTYLQDGDEALIPNPGYPTYAAAVRLSGAAPRPYRLAASKNWLPDLDALAQEDLSRVKLMWVNYPHMPTGARADRGFFDQLVAFAKDHGILLCHDNPYSFILNDRPQSILAAQDAKDACIELNSLSKSSNMAGWRVGMLVGAASRINEIQRFKSNMDSGMFLPVQLAAAQALSLDPSWYDSLNTHYVERREWARRILDRLGCTYAKEQSGLFIWSEVPLERFGSGYALSDAVLDQARLFITPGGIFGDAGEAYVRISLCAPVETFSEALTRLERTELFRKTT